MVTKNHKSIILTVIMNKQAKEFGQLRAQ